jgi:predicted DNA-binding transcriptional regulator YafY
MHPLSQARFIMKPQAKPSLELTPEEIAQLEASYEASSDFEEIKFAPQTSALSFEADGSGMDLEATIDIIDFADDDLLEMDDIHADALLSTLIKPKKS